MGAFYGSVQVRSADRDRVRTAAEEVARQRQIHMLLGPPLGDWIAVYPEGSGQDHAVGREIAERITGDVLHFLVHDEDIFAYWLYRDGRLVDSFHSRPGYFGKESLAEEESMIGNPEAFRPLIDDRVEKLRPLLVRDERTMESERLDSFAKVLGISNALTSYEYLKEDDHQGIKGWRKFEELPADEIAHAKAQKRWAKELFKSEVKRLKAEGLLLDRKLSRDEMPSACGLAQDLFVAWADPCKDTVSFRRYKAPRKTPEPVPLKTAGITQMTVSDAQGRRVAMAVRGCVQVWDVAGTTWTHVCDIATPMGVSGLAISSDGKLVAHSSRRSQTVVTDVASGQRLLEIPDHNFEQAVFHPSGEWLAVGLPDCALISIHQEPHWRQLVQRPTEWPLARVARSLKVDVATLIEQTRQLGENRASLERQVLPEKIRAVFEDPLVVAARSKHREEQAAKLAQMEADWAAIQRGEPPRPGPVQETRTVGFTRDGRWLWRGTLSGLFLYECSAILEQAPELPDPAGRLALPSIENQPLRIVQAVAEEPNAQALVFGGATGRLYRLDLKSGQARELIKLPADCHIQTLAFAKDGATLGIVSQGFPLSPDATKYIEVGTIWEVWNYPRLRDGGAVAGEAD